MKEADIARHFRNNLSGHWTMIENTVSSGVPDALLSNKGKMCWIEFKRLYGCDIILRPSQHVWIYKELRHNGRIMIAWWDNGPVAMPARALYTMNPEKKRGKLYYDVKNSEHGIRGYINIANYIFD